MLRRYALGSSHYSGVRELDARQNERSIAQSIMDGAMPAGRRTPSRIERNRWARKVRRGFIVYEGPSALDGRPIVAIITIKTKNPKTGPMAQLWILRPDVSPGKAIRTGLDVSICGTCPLRAIDANGNRQVRRCYVNPMGPASVYRTYRRGRYAVATPVTLWAMLAGRTVRLGAYGDPAALPIDVVATIVAFAVRHTGYTHQRRTVSPEWARYVMASADNAADRLEAKAQGYRTFRVVAPGDTIDKSEIHCPASEEQGKRTTCDRCTLCAGNAGRYTGLKDVAIYAHGVGKRFFTMTPVSA